MPNLESEIGSIRRLILELKRKEKQHLVIQIQYFILLLLIIVSFGCNSDIVSQSEKPYLIIYAFNAEGDVLKDSMNIETEEYQLGHTIYIGQLGEKDVIVAKSGVGMTNAAIYLQRMIDEYTPKAVIMTGIAGAIDSSIKIGDIVVPDTWMEHDYGYDGTNGFEHKPMYIYAPNLDSMIYNDKYYVDTTFLKIAFSIIEDTIKLKPIINRNAAIHVGGIGVSGNSFIDSQEKRFWLTKSFSPLITDMESAAVAQTCFINGLPFIVFRSASDLAGGSGSNTAKSEMKQFFVVAAENSATVVIHFLEKL